MVFVKNYLFVFVIILILNAVLGPPSANKLDHVKFPSENTSGPKYITWYIAVLTRSFPGNGLRCLLNNIYFCTQYIQIRPSNPNIAIIGWSDTKKQVNKYTLTGYIYYNPI